MGREVRFVFMEGDPRVASLLSVVHLASKSLIFSAEIILSG